MSNLADATIADGEPKKLDIEDTASLMSGRTSVKSFALTGLLILACFYTLYFASEFFLPVVLAFLFNFLLGPIVRWLGKLHIPLFAGAAVVILAVFAVLGLAVYELTGPVSNWVGRAPEIAAKLKHGFQKPVQRVTQATEQVQNIAAVNTPQRPTPQVELKKPSPLEGLFTRTYNIVFGLIELTVLLYFLLSSGDMFLRKLIHVLPKLADKKRAVQIAREIEDSISGYLLTVAIINACLGTAAGLIFWALGMPNPALWGAVGFVLNFIPYLGALITIGITSVVAVATFPNLGHALLVPAAYLALGTIEGNFVTPYVLGRRLTLNPVVIFLGLTFWGWMWGIVGALLAVPMLVTLKIFCDHIEPLAPIGEFLGHERSG